MPALDGFGLRHSARAARAPTICRGWPSSSTRLAPRRTAAGGRTWSATPASTSCTASPARSASPSVASRATTTTSPRSATRPSSPPAPGRPPARDLLRALQASGLRMQKRRGDKGVARVRGIRFVDGTTADVDLIRSDREADEPAGLRGDGLRADDAGDFAARPLRPARPVGSPGGWREPGESVRENAVREIREETGLVVDPDAPPAARLRALPWSLAGRPVAGGPRPAAGLRGARAGPAPGPRLRARRHLDRRWTTWAELERECSGPVLVAAGRRGAQPARRVSSRARFSRADGSHSARACAVR